VRALKASEPDEVYNLAAHSFVQRSFGQPVFTADVTGLGVARILEAIRENAPGVRFYQASSSEMFGNTSESPQNEATLLVPASPYAVAKVFGHLLTQNYRRAYDLFACSGILFNHESPRRGIHFVTRKVTDGAARISLGLAKDLQLGNLDARRDWGFAGDYVRAMWLMLQQDHPDDYVIATGENHSVRDLCELAFGLVGLDYREYVVVDEANLRPSDVAELRGDASKARAAFGWEPTVDFVTVRLNQTMNTNEVRFGLSDIGVPQAITWLIAFVVAGVAAWKGSFSLAVLATLLIAPGLHLHYWLYALVPVLGIGFPRLIQGEAAIRAS
jgi:GDPmannose 4,6-dehydratase